MNGPYFETEDVTYPFIRNVFEMLSNYFMAVNYKNRNQIEPKYVLDFN